MVGWACPARVLILQVKFQLLNYILDSLHVYFRYGSITDQYGSINTDQLKPALCNSVMFQESIVQLSNWATDCAMFQESSNPVQTLYPGMTAYTTH